MAGYFERVEDERGGAAIALDRAQISILRTLTVQLLELIGPGDEAAQDDDPLAALFAEGPAEPPEDPVLARLFPDAYGGPGAASGDEEDRERSAEFRRYTEGELRARKRADGLALVRTLDALAADAPAGDEPDPGAVLRLDPQECRQWLGTLNDLRLAIGTRLEISEESDTDVLFGREDDDPVKPIVMAYLWLGGLQESLLETLLS